MMVSYMQIQYFIVVMFIYYFTTAVNNFIILVYILPMSVLLYYYMAFTPVVLQTIMYLLQVPVHPSALVVIHNFVVWRFINYYQYVIHLTTVMIDLFVA